MHDRPNFPMRAAGRVRWILERIFSDKTPRIALSRWLFFRVFPSEVQLVDDLGDQRAALSRDALRTILELARSAISSGQIRRFDVEGISIEIDGQPPRHPVTFDDNPLSWIWNPGQISRAIEPTTDYFWIDIQTSAGRTRGTIERSRLELACTALHHLETRSDANFT
jgi:hypothetical protein